MNFSQIRYFLVLSESRSFTEAAKKLYIAQPSLSKQISAIEAQLNVRLFDRNRKSTALTPAGEYFYKGCQKILADYNKLVVETQHINRNAPHVLTIGILEYQRFSEDLMVVRNALEEALPGICIRFVSLGYHALLEGLANERLDAIVTMDFELSHTPAFLFRRLSRLRNLLVVSAGHPLAERPGLTLRDFQNELFLSVTDQESPNITPLLLNSCEKAGFQPRIRFEESYSDLVTSLEMGLGLFALNDEHYLYGHPGLKFLAVPEIHEAYKVLAWSPNNRNPVVPVLLEIVEKNFCR